MPRRTGCSVRTPGSLARLPARSHACERVQLMRSGPGRRTSRQAPAGWRPPSWPAAWPGPGGGLGARPCQAGAVRGDAPLDGLGEVLPQVEPVGDLDRLRCPGPGAVGVGTGAVTADDLDAGMRGQPVRQRLGVTAFQQVQRGARLAVNQQRVIALAAAEREVIDSEHPRGADCRVRRGHDQPQQHLPGSPGRRGRRPAARLPSRPARPRYPARRRPAAGSCARNGRSDPGPARRTSCAVFRPVVWACDLHATNARRGRATCRRAAIYVAVRCILVMTMGLSSGGVEDHWKR